MDAVTGNGCDDKMSCKIPTMILLRVDAERALGTMEKVQMRQAPCVGLGDNSLSCSKTKSDPHGPEKYEDNRTGQSRRSSQACFSLFFFIQSQSLGCA